MAHLIVFFSVLDKNPFHCNCQLLHFIRFAKSKNIDLSWEEEPQCQTPSVLTGTLLKDLPLQQMFRNCSVTSTTVTPATTDDGNISIGTTVGEIFTQNYIS
jgi:hypothetical protein